MAHSWQVSGSKHGQDDMMMSQALQRQAIHPASEHRTSEGLTLSVPCYYTVAQLQPSAKSPLRDACQRNAFSLSLRLSRSRMPGTKTHHNLKAFAHANVYLFIPGQLGFVLEQCIQSVVHQFVCVSMSMMEFIYIRPHCCSI